MSLVFNPYFSFPCRPRPRRHIFPAAAAVVSHEFGMMSMSSTTSTTYKSSSLSVVGCCNIKSNNNNFKDHRPTPTVPVTSHEDVVMAKMKDKIHKSLLLQVHHHHHHHHRHADIPSLLCIVDTLERLGLERYFQSQMDSVLEETYRLWQHKDKEKYISSNITTHAMAFRLLRLRGHQVSSEELAPYCDALSLETIEALELYRAAKARMYEDEDSSLVKIHGVCTTILNHRLLTNAISDAKLHKLVEYYLNNYDGIYDRLGVRRNLDLYDTRHYSQTHLNNSRFVNLCNEDFLAFARQDFDICQAQHRKELPLLQRWYSDCRLHELKYERNVTRVSNFLISTIIGDPELSDFRLAFAKHVVLVTQIDDFFDHAGSREESHELLQLVKEWKEKAAGEYGSEQVEILFTAVYKTVNELSVMAQVQQGRNVKDLLIQMWVEIITSFKMEWDTWSDDTPLSLDEYLSFSCYSIGCRICILAGIQFFGVKLSEEMLLSQECIHMWKHVSIVNRLHNDIRTYEKELKEKTKNSVGILLASSGKDNGINISSAEEAKMEIKEMIEYSRRRLMQIVYKKGTVFPRNCKDVFLKVCRIGCYLYTKNDGFSSQQQIMEDIEALLHQPASATSTATATAAASSSSHSNPT